MTPQKLLFLEVFQHQLFFYDPARIHNSSLSWFWSMKILAPAGHGDWPAGTVAKLMRSLLHDQA